MCPSSHGCLRCSKGAIVDCWCFRLLMFQIVSSSGCIVVALYTVVSVCSVVAWSFCGPWMYFCWNWQTEMVSMEEGRSCLKASSSYIQGVLVGVLGSADIYSQFKLIIPPEVRSYFLLIVPWLDGLCVRVCIRWRWHKYLKWCEFVKKTYVEKRRIGGVRVHEGQGHN